MMEVEEEDEMGNMEVFLVPREGGLRGWIGELLSCHWCTGIWSAIALYGLYMIYPSFMQAVILIMAIAGFAAFIETLVQKWISD